MIMVLLSYVITAAAGYAMWWLWRSGVQTDTLVEHTDPEGN